MPRKYLSLLPFALILIFIIVVYVTGAYHFISFDVIQEEHLKWKSFVLDHPFLSALYYIGIYTLSVVLIIPDSTLLTLVGGFLFPMPLAITYACFSETLGGFLFFLAARLASTQTLGKKNRGFFHKMQRKVQKNQVNYLLFLRFSHLFPFWIINLAAGIFHVRPLLFIWTTLVGVFPLTFVLVEAGESLSKYFETHEHFSLMGVFTPALKLSLIALGVISLLPIVYKAIKNRHKKHFWKL